MVRHQSQLAPSALQARKALRLGLRRRVPAQRVLPDTTLLLELVRVVLFLVQQLDIQALLDLVLVQQDMMVL